MLIYVIASIFVNFFEDLSVQNKIRDDMCTILYKI